MKKTISESIDALEPRIIKIFKFLNEEKKNHKTRAALLEKIGSLLGYVSVPEDYALYILEAYLLNFRKDGDYSSLNKENFVDPRKMKGKLTPNTKASKYSIAQLPFRGSNLQGFWERDYEGVPQYVVESYNWYPVFIYKNDKWYEVTKRYSSSTSRQMSNANPVKYSEDLLDKVYLLSPDEMKLIRRGTSHDDVMKHKLEKIKKDEPELVSKKTITLKPYRFYDGNASEPIVIKYKIESIDIEGEKGIVNIDVYDVLKKVDGKGVETPENYLKGELRGITKERVEKEISQKILQKFKDYIGPRVRYDILLKDIHKVKFNFNHLRK